MLATATASSSLASRPRNLILAASLGAASILVLTVIAALVNDGGDGRGKRKRKSSSRKQNKSKKQQPIYIRGLYNLGNTCFMNSTLQSLASIDQFNRYTESCVQLAKQRVIINTDAEIVIQLKNILDQLEPQPRKVPAISPREFINTLSKKGRWMASQTEQDAHEFFQMVSSTLQSTIRDVPDSNTLFDSGFLFDGTTSKANSSFISTSSEGKTLQPQLPSNPLQGMAATRTTCVKCGYTAAIRHSTFDNIMLTVPRTHTTTIEECLSLYTIIDQLDDFKCRRCALKATLSKLQLEIGQCQAGVDMVNSKPKRAKKAANNIALLKDQESRVSQAIFENPEQELKGIQLAPASLPVLSTKQTMIARTPKILAIHLSRSIYMPTGDTIKNNAHVKLQPLLDISPFATTGHINTNASTPISGTSLHGNGSTSYIEAQRNNCLYRLCAVTIHVGAHESGHYYSYRRVPTTPMDEEKSHSLTDPGRWLMISDTDAVEVPFETVTGSGSACMLFYERL